MHQHEQSIKQELSQHNPRKVPFIPSLFEKQTLSLFASPIKCTAFVERLGRLGIRLPCAECERTSTRLPQAPQTTPYKLPSEAFPAQCPSQQWQCHAGGGEPLGSAASRPSAVLMALNNISHCPPHLFWSPAAIRSTKSLSPCIHCWLCCTFAPKWFQSAALCRWQYYPPEEKDSKGGFLWMTDQVVI